MQTTYENKKSWKTHAWSLVWSLHKDVIFVLQGIRIYIHLLTIFDITQLLNGKIDWDWIILFRLILVLVIVSILTTCVSTFYIWLVVRQEQTIEMADVLLIRNLHGLTSDLQGLEHLRAFVEANVQE